MAFSKVLPSDLTRSGGWRRIARSVPAPPAADSCWSSCCPTLGHVRRPPRLDESHFLPGTSSFHWPATTTAEWWWTRSQSHWALVSVPLATPPRAPRCRWSPPWCGRSGCWRTSAWPLGSAPSRAVGRQQRGRSMFPCVLHSSEEAAKHLNIWIHTLIYLHWFLQTHQNMKVMSLYQCTFLLKHSQKPCTVMQCVSLPNVYFY